MLIEIKKQVTETMEVKTPCFYKSFLGYYFINENGVLVAVKKHMIYVWDQSYGNIYTQAIEEILRDGEPCERSEFEAAYNGALLYFQAAVDGVVVNS
jgi:hypothetical protein